MPPSTPGFAALLDKIAEWGQLQPDLLAGVIVGSYARTDPSPDRWSDVDLFFFVSDLAPFTQNRAWLEEFGTLWAAYLENPDGGMPEWFALYAGGLKLDIALFAVSSISAAGGDVADWLRAFPYPEVLARGYRVLFLRDSESLPDQLPIFHQTPLQAPTEEDLSQHLQHLLIVAHKCASLLGRGELWRAHQVYAVDLRKLLLKLIEWHALACSSAGVDTWYGGRLIEKWAGVELITVFQEIFPGFAPGELINALKTLIQLGRQLADETAKVYGYPQPLSQLPAIIDWLETYLARAAETEF